MPAFRLVSSLAHSRAFEPDESQRAVIESQAQTIEVLGSAGTGKTTTLVETVIAQIHRGTDPAKVLVISLDQPAAATFASRVATGLGPGFAAIASHTFYSLAVKMWANQSKPELITAARIDKGTQVLRIAQLLPESHIEWPERLREAVKTRSFARHVSDFIGRMAVLGIDEDELTVRAEQENREDWKALAQFKREFDQVCSISGEIYFAQILEDAEHFARDYSYDLVVVDAFEEIDDAQLRVLKNLVGPTTRLIVASDPDQTVNAFRGSTRSATWEFSEHFADSETIVLTTNYRNNEKIAAASLAMINRTGLTGVLDEDSYRRYRAPKTQAGGVVEVKTFDSFVAEAEHIAHIVRSAHLIDHIAYSDIAILTRRGGESHRIITQALHRMEVPARVPLEQIMLIDHPAVNHMVHGVDVCVAMSKGQSLDPDAVMALLQGPLFVIDPADIRRYGRFLRQYARSNDELIRADVALVDALLAPDTAPEPPEFLIGVAQHLKRVSALLHEVAALIAKGVDAEQVLWKLWHDSGWEKRILNQMDIGGNSSRIAHSDADAMVALFESAAVTAETTRLPIEIFIDELKNQEIPNNPVRPRSLASDSVTIMTAHRAKGMEFKLVIIAGVQENVWPTTHSAASLLGTDELDDSGQGLSTQSLRNEERRLFYLALTRASERVVITAVQGQEKNSDAPSRFVEEIQKLPDVDSVHHNRLPTSMLTMRNIVAQLRAIAENNEPLRDQAAARLAGLQELTDAADPRTWWGITEAVDAEVPWRDLNEPIKTSATQLSALEECSLKWFFEHEIKMSDARDSSLIFGSLVHAIAELSATSDFDLDSVTSLLDEVWINVPYEFAWQATRERKEAQHAIERFLAWKEQNQRKLIGSELKFETTVTVAGHDFVITGFIDRVEIDNNGNVYVIDLKTNSKAPNGEELKRHIQMGLYDLAVSHGAIEGVKEATEELVLLRIPAEVDPQLPVVGVVNKESTTVARDALAKAVEVFQTESLLATPSSKTCKYCSFAEVCPAKDGASIFGGVV